MTTSEDNGVHTRPGWLRVLLDLGKVRITIAVTLTTTLGYLMARHRLSLDIWLPLLGTFLVASGASALNQWQEAAMDSRMERTRRRPIPAGHLDPTTALFIAGLMMLAGLYALTSVAADPYTLLALALAAVAWYNGVYTYLKRVTAFAVVPGALIGAIPPVIGYVADGGNLRDPAILLVAGFLFIWQVPHFWLLMILLEEQYARAGLPTLGRTFTKAQLHRVTFMWIMATAVTGLASCWLMTVAVSVLWAARTSDDAGVFRRAFIRINLFALLFFISLSLNALGLTLR
jgi:protoheme IX farnesyltransferase